MNLQKILIVDGDPSVLLDLVGFLSDTSYEVYTAQDGLECLLFYLYSYRRRRVVERVQSRMRQYILCTAAGRSLHPFRYGCA